MYEILLIPFSSITFANVGLSIISESPTEFGASLSAVILFVAAISAFTIVPFIIFALATESLASSLAHTASAAIAAASTELFLRLTLFHVP